MLRERYARWSTGEYKAAVSLQEAYMHRAEGAVAAGVSSSVAFGPFAGWHGMKKIEDLSELNVLQGQQVQESQQVLMVTIRLHVFTDLQNSYFYDVGSIKLQVLQMVWRLFMSALTDWRVSWMRCRP